MATLKDANTLTSYYVKCFKKVHKREPNVNRFTARWGFDQVLGGMNVGRGKELIDYYFTTPADRDHSLDWFFYNYDSLITGMEQTKKDQEASAKLMVESKQRAEEWRAGGKHGITGD